MLYSAYKHWLLSQRGQSHNLPGGGNGRDTIGILGVGQLESIPIYFSAHVWHMTSAMALS